MFLILTVTASAHGTAAAGATAGTGGLPLLPQTDLPLDHPYHSEQNNSKDQSTQKVHIQPPIYASAFLP